MTNRGINNLKFVVNNSALGIIKMMFLITVSLELLWESMNVSTKTFQKLNDVGGVVAFQISNQNIICSMFDEEKAKLID